MLRDVVRCLIVDDSPRFADEARSLLESEGISVVGVAESGDEAVRLTEELTPDIALLDVGLGAESGFDVARRIADGSEGRRPRLIFISTYDEDEFRDRIASSPALGFIAKAELSAERIRKLLSN